MKRRTLILTLLAAALIITAGISSTFAYFTAVDKVKGKVVLDLGYSDEIKEDFKDFEKHVTIKNTGKQPVFVRVKAFAGSEVEVSYKGDNWTKGEGDFYYYSDPIAPGESTPDELIIHVALPQSEDEISEDFDLYNVAVVQEYAPVKYDADGKAYADWEAKSTEGES